MAYGAIMLETQEPVCQPQPIAKPKVESEPQTQREKQRLVTMRIMLFVVAATICPILTIWVVHLVQKPEQAKLQSALAERKQAKTHKEDAEYLRNHALEARRSTADQLEEARAAKRATQRSAKVTKAVLVFLRDHLLAEDSKKRSGGDAGKDVTLRQAVDAAEPKVAEMFGDEPLAEASIRMVLGSIYKDLGDLKRAAAQFERAMLLREDELGLDNQAAGDCRNQLAVAYRLLGRPDDASRLFNQNRITPTRAAQLSVEGSALLAQNKPLEAELKLRECLAIRQKTHPDDWITYDTKTMLGAALLEQKNYAAAEKQLVSGYRGMKQREAKMPLAARKARLTKALERLVKLYESWGKPDQAATWRTELEAAQPSKKG